MPGSSGQMTFFLEFLLCGKLDVTTMFVIFDYTCGGSKQKFVWARMILSKNRSESNGASCQYISSRQHYIHSVSCIPDECSRLLTRIPRKNDDGTVGARHSHQVKIYHISIGKANGSLQDCSPSFVGKLLWKNGRKWLMVGTRRRAFSKRRCNEE